MAAHVFTPLRRSLLPLAAACALLSGSGCGSQFDPSSKLNNVRILAVTKEVQPGPTGSGSLAYAHPESKVKLTLTAWDGKSSNDSQRRLSVEWLSGCVNPEGDLYYGCYPQLARALLSTGPILQFIPGAGMADAGTDDASTMSDASGDDAGASSPGGGSPIQDVAITIPIPARDQIITHLATESGPAYGLEYVFFAVCPGTFGLPRGDTGSGLPIRCTDEQGHDLGPDDFVIGYTAIYVYDTLENVNPIVNGIRFGGAPYDPAKPQHVPHCASADRGNCPKFKVQLDVDRSSAETDPVGKDQNGNSLKEQIWVDYYATAGDLGSPVRLVNDATAGWNDDDGTDWQAPAEAGTVVHVWAVVHDNRGGIAKARADILVD